MKYLIILLIYTPIVTAGDWYLDSITHSYHYFERGLNETHNGVGLSYQFDEYTYSIGTYYNSYESQSNYLSLSKLIFREGILSVDAGVIVMDGYSDFAVLPAMTFQAHSHKDVIRLGFVVTPVLIAFKPSIRF